MKQAGIPDQLVEEFIEHLERRGRGSYTVRSYRLGLADFSRWLRRAGRELDAARRRDIEAYIGEFAAGPGQASRRAGVVDLATDRPVPARRAARTINHRLSVLASFFAFLIDRDTEDGGAWAGRVSPVPARPGELSHSMGGGGDAPPRRKRAELRRRNPENCQSSSTQTRSSGSSLPPGRGGTRRSWCCSLGPGNELGTGVPCTVATGSSG